MALKKYAKANTKANTTVITTRIPTEIHTRFKNYCDSLGLTVSEAVKYLIDEELNTDENTESIQNVYTPPDEKLTKGIQNVIKVEEQKPKREPNYYFDEDEQCIRRIWTQEELDELPDEYFTRYDIEKLKKKVEKGQKLTQDERELYDVTCCIVMEQEEPYLNTNPISYTY